MKNRKPGMNNGKGLPRYKGFIKTLLGSQLLLLTSLNAFDGNALAMGSTGAISNPMVSAIYGLTCIAGVGAFAVAITELGTEQRTAKWQLFVSMAAISSVLVITAVTLGGVIGNTFDARFVQIFGGMAVFLIGLMIAGVKIPSLKYFPTPLVIVSVGIIMEVIAFSL